MERSKSSSHTGAFWPASVTSSIYRDSASQIIHKDDITRPIWSHFTLVKIESDQRYSSLPIFFIQIGPLTETRWQMSGGRGKGQEDDIDIHVTPPDGEEDDEFIPTPAIRMRRKLSTPLSALPSFSDSLLGLQSKLLLTCLNCLYLYQELSRLGIRYLITITK